MQFNFLLKSIIIIIFAAALSVIIAACGDSNTVSNQVNETLLYEEPGLVDSAVVTGCYAFIRSHFLNDTFSFNAYSKIKVEFDGYSTSDHATISVLTNSEFLTNETIYSSSNAELNKFHSFEVPSPSDTVWLELRLYMNPQVCGENEFKYIRARDLKVIGIK